MIIGASSGGKSEYLRAFYKIGEHRIDDLTEHSLVSGYKIGAAKDEPQFAELLQNNIWYIQDLSIIISKRAEVRSEVFSQLRMVYDGELKRRVGTKETISCNTENNTLICASTPVIDNTIVEDALLGTRFVQYRLPKNNRMLQMEIIDRNKENVVAMRGSLNVGVSDWETNIEVKPYEITPHELQILQRLCDMTTLLRTSVQCDRTGEPMNVASVEEPGRFYRQVVKMYESYRIIGLNEEESIRAIRKLCQDNINPIRMRIIKALMIYRKKDDYGHSGGLTTSRISQMTGMGKKTVKREMHSLNLIGLADYKVIEHDYGRTTDQWHLLESNLHLLTAEGFKHSCGKSLARIHYARNNKEKLD
jgi:hypothetical protein